MPSSKGKPQPEYDERFKANAVAKLYAEGYPAFPGALRKVSAELGVPHQTLSRWVKGLGTTVDMRLVELAVSSMETVIDERLDQILGKMEEKADKAQFKELAIAFGILFDKRQLLRGAPTSRTERLTHDAMKEKSDEELRKIVNNGRRVERDAAERAATPRESGSGASSADPVL
jgi:hypothetical protein